MAWLTLFNGVAAQVENPPEYEVAKAIVAELNSRKALEGFEINIEQTGGMTVYPSDRRARATIYGSGNADEFKQSWLGPGAMKDNCAVWPVGTNAQAPSEAERQACLEAARIVAERLGEGAGVGPLNYGFHIFCFD